MHNGWILRFLLRPVRQAQGYGGQAAQEDRIVGGGASNRTCSSRVTCHPSLPNAFTLLELIVVVGLIAGLSYFLIGNLAGGSNAVALQAAQSTVAGLIAAARTQATASGVPARVLLNIDLRVPDRYLRCLALQRQEGSDWQTITVVTLPEEVGVLPRDPGMPANLLVAAGSWSRPSDGTVLRSSVFRANSGGFPDAEISAAIDSPDAGQWVVIKFSALGTTLNTGDVVLAPLRRLAPGSYAAGESPVSFSNPDGVRGLSLSSYGLASLVGSRAGF